MKTKNPLLFASGCIAFLIVIWLFWHRAPSDATGGASRVAITNSYPNETTLRPNLTSNTQSRTQLNGNEQLASSNVNTLNEVSNVLKDGEARYLAKAIRPIEFYGKVIDENQQPVEGVDIAFSETYTSPAINMKSDANGLFSLRNVSGRYLSVDVSKEGYYGSKSNRMSFDYSPELATNLHRPVESNPVLFHLRKKKEGADMITSQIGMRPELEFSTPRDGTPTWVNFLNQKVGGEGQLEISSIKPAPGEKDATWLFRMSIPGGGFVESNEEFPFEAPVSGYQPTIEFNFRAGDTNSTEIINKQYYVVFGQPAKYGRITIETGMSRGVYLGYAINPDGSRYLEPK